MSSHKRNQSEFWVLMTYMKRWHSYELIVTDVENQVAFRKGEDEDREYV
jgi:hypothetical protein